MDNNRIEINGQSYILESSIQENISPIQTDHIIVIAQRGWIFEGYQNREVGSEKIQLLNANVVRRWSNGKGIGGLVKSADEYTLDLVGQVEFAYESIIAIIKCEW